MIILRTRHFSLDRKMIEKIEEKLDKLGVEDYDISKKIPLDTISVSSDFVTPKIYIPRDYEYSQYDIDDFIRSIIPFAKTKTIYDMSISTPIKLDQYCKLIKYISEEWEFCTILE